MQVTLQTIATMPQNSLSNNLAESILPVIFDQPSMGDTDKPINLHNAPI